MRKIFCGGKQFYSLIAVEGKMYKWTLSADDSAMRKGSVMRSTNLNTHPKIRAEMKVEEIDGETTGWAIKIR